MTELIVALDGPNPLELLRELRHNDVEWFGTCHSRRRPTVAPVPAKCDAIPPIAAESHRRVQRPRPILDDRRWPTLTTPPSLAFAQAAARSNPHRRQTARQRPAASFLGGFRTPTLSTGG
jgi:hypothetical protein